MKNEKYLSLNKVGPSWHFRLASARYAGDAAACFDPHQHQKLPNTHRGNMAVHVYIDWPLIVLPIVSVLVVAFVLLIFWLLKSKHSFDVHRSKDGHSYRILDL